MGAWSVTGPQTITGNSTITGNETISGTLGVTGATSTGALTVTGTAAISGNETVGGTLTVTGASTLSGNATVGGNEAVTGTLTVTGQSSLNGGAVVQTGLTAGVSGLFNEYCFRNVGSVNWTGGFTITQTIAFARIGAMCLLFIGQSAAATGTNAVATCSLTLPVEMRPGTVNRGGAAMIFDNGVTLMGAFRVSTAGVITFGKSVNTSGVLVAYDGGAGQTGIADGVYAYSLY